MKIFHSRFNTRRLSYLTGLVLAGVIVASQSLMMPIASADGNDRMYLTPSVGNYNVGQEITLQVRENSNNEAINAVQFDITYTQATLQFLSIDDTGSAFGVSAQKTGGSGVITIARGSTSPLTMDKFVAYLNFKVIAPGVGSIQISNSSVVVGHVGNKNIMDTRTGASFNLIMPPGPAGPPGPTGRPGPVGPSGRPAPIPTTYPIATPAPGAKPNISIAPNPTPTTPTPQPTLLPDDSEIEINEPSTLETTPSDSEIVEKVEYYVDGKLIKTVTEPPYSYSVDTKSMKNGTYTLTVKTYYEDGKVDSVDTNLNVKNAASLGQTVMKFSWLIILLLIIIAGAVWFVFFRNRGGGDDEFGGGYGDEFGGQPPADGDYSNPYSSGPPPPNAQITPQGPPPPDQQFMPQDPMFGNPALGNPGASAMPPDLNSQLPPDLNQRFPPPPDPTSQDQPLPPNDPQINRF